MNDRELADRIVALGVGARADDGDSIKVYDYTLNQFYWFTPRQAVRDWRVAGALMEKCRAKGIYIIVEQGGIIIPLGITPNGETISTGAVIDKSLPRAICEACVEALDGR